MWKPIALAAALIMPATASDALSLYPHPGYSLPVHIAGRTAPSSAGYGYQWPGIYFESRFHGTQVEVLFNADSSNFNVLLDGELLMIVRKPGRRSVTVSTSDGPHTVRVEKRSETQYATGHFLGFSVPSKAAVMPAPPAPARRIEFIGDSFVVGYGNTSAYTQCTPEEIFETTDVQQGFGPIVAKHFDADYRINAFSGLGMVRNFGGYEHPKYHMPMLYPRTIYDDPTPVKDDWQPQVVFINIGGNDFSTPLKADEPWKTADELRQDFTRTYITFVQDLRRRYPKAYFLLTSSPGGSADYANSVTAVVDTLKSAGETRIERLTMPSVQRTGCNAHPDVRSDRKVADLLIDYLGAHPDLLPPNPKAGN